MDQLLGALLLSVEKMREEIAALRAEQSEMKAMIEKGRRSKTQTPGNWHRLDDILRMEEFRRIGITHRRHLVNCGIHCGILREGIEYRMAASGGRGSLGYQFEADRLLARIEWFYSMPPRDRLHQFGVDNFKCYPNQNAA